MKLINKTVLIISLTTLVLIAGLYFSANYIVVSSFRKIEKNEAEKALTRVEKSLSLILDEVDTLLKDWSNWDDTYYFAKNQNQQYIKSNLKDNSTFYNANLCLVAITDADNKVIYKKYYSSESEKEEDLPERLEEILAEKFSLLSEAYSKGVKKGILCLKDKIVFVTARPILKSTGEGPAAGLIIFVSPYNDDRVTQLKKIITNNFSFTCAKIMHDDGIKKASKIVSPGTPKYINLSNDEIIYAYTAIKDINGNSNLTVKIEIPRYIYTQALKARRLLLAFIMAGGLAFSLIIIVLLRQNILKKVFSFRRSVDKITDLEDIGSKRIKIESSDEIGDLAESFNHMLDILSRKNVELFENQEQIKLAFDAAHEGLWNWNVDTGDAYFSPRYFTMLGYDPDEFPANYDTWFSLLHPEDRDQAVKDIGECVSDPTKNTLHIEFRMKTKNNDWLWIKGQGKVLERDNNSKAVKMAGTHVDITSLKVTENMLRESQQLYSTILNNSTDMIFMVDCEGIVTYHNSAVDKHYNLPEKADNMVKLEYFWCAESIEKVQEAFRTVTNNRITVSTDCKCGESYYEIKLTPIISDEDVSFVICVARDISIRKKTEEYHSRARKEAEEANRMKDDFFANMSHELRTPLNSIIGFAEALVHSRDLQETHSKANVILSESDTLLSLINESLDLARIKSGKLEIAEEAFDILDLIDQLKSSHAIHAKNKGIELTIDVKDELSQYYCGDVLRIRQILSNLINNAIKFTDRGSVKVSAEISSVIDNREIVRFSIDDTGIGISEDKLEKVFARFTQVDSSTTRRYGGSGLGITITNELLKLMGGELKVKSRPEEGSTFWFEIALMPVTREDYLDNLQQADNHIDINNLKKAAILVVDDYPANLEVAKIHLEHAGHRVTTAADGYTALKMLEEHDFDLVIMDLQMPEIDGYDTTRKIRQGNISYSEVKILGMTANTSPRDLQECRNCGMDDIISKPVKRNILLGKVDTLLGNQSSDMELEEGRTTADIPIDIDEAIEELCGKRDVLLKLVDKIISDLPDEIEKMQTAVIEEDWKTIKYISHKIYGGASNLSIKQIAVTAREIESTEYGSAKKVYLKELIDKLEVELHELKNYISTLK
ncbi:MAG: CHASE4 domain-containing protein [Planctomycetota bacterium]|jgi:PAS domain S-box-containing protein